MYITVKVSGVDRLRATIALRKKRVSDLTVPIEQALALTRDDAVRRFAMEGDPKWTPSRKTESIALRLRHGGTVIIHGDGGQTGTVSGNLRRSIQTEPVVNNYGRVGSNLKYAAWFQEGTGEFATGPRAGRTSWTIGTIYGPRDPRGLKNLGNKSGPGLKGTRPLPARTLCWSFGGRVFFARSVTIRGQPPRPYLLFSDPLVEAIILRFKTLLAENSGA